MKQELTKELTKEDVWGKFSDDHSILIDRGMIVAQGMPSDISPSEKKKIQDKIKVPDICPIWRDALPYKSVTVICDFKQRDEVESLLRYVHGGDCVSDTQVLPGGKYAIRSNYMCW